MRILIIKTIDMEIQEFIQNFKEQFDDADMIDLGANTEFKNLKEWSSIVVLSIIAMIDEEYDVRIKGDDIRSCRTIEDLFNLVQTRKNG